MSTDRDVARIVRSWLEEGVTALPDRVLDGVLDQLPATPQRRAWWPARRLRNMNVLTKLGVAAATVVAVAVVGLSTLPRLGGVLGPGSGPTPEPTRSLVPSTTAEPTGSSGASIFPTSGLISPGRYTWIWPNGQASVEIPVGWTAHDAGAGMEKHPDQPGEIGWGVVAPGRYVPIMHVYSDACRSTGNLEPVGSTVEDLVRALDQQRATDAVIADITIDGRPAKRIELTQAAGLDRKTCRYGALGPLQIWANVAETDFYALAPRRAGTVYIVDFDGQRIVFTAAHHDEVREADLAEFRAMIESIRLAP